MFEILVAVMMTAFALTSIGVTVMVIAWAVTSVVDLLDRVDNVRRYRGKP